MDAREAFEQIVQFFTRDRLYLAQYVSTVQVQHADYTLDLLPDDKRVRGTGLSNVEIWHGIPGVRVKVAAGARVKLGWHAGDPRKPYAALWDPGAIELIEFDGGQAPVARVGDPVEVFWPSPVTITGTITGVGALTATAALATPGVGVIQSGNSKVKA
jgi:hypothetical protein